VGALINIVVNEALVQDVLCKHMLMSVSHGLPLVSRLLGFRRMP